MNRAIAFELLVMPCSTQFCFFIPNRFYPLSYNIDDGGSNGSNFRRVFKALTIPVLVMSGDMTSTKSWPGTQQQKATMGCQTL